MKQISQKSASLLILTRQDFTTRSQNFRGERDNESYVVWSYATLIAEYWQGVWYINDTNYGPVTSRHQYQVWLALGDYDWINNTIHVDGLQRNIRSLWAYADCNPIGTTLRKRTERISGRR